MPIDVLVVIGFYAALDVSKLLRRKVPMHVILSYHIRRSPTKNQKLIFVQFISISWELPCKTEYSTKARRVCSCQFLEIEVPSIRK